MIPKAHLTSPTGLPKPAICAQLLAGSLAYQPVLNNGVLATALGAAAGLNVCVGVLIINPSPDRRGAAPP